ncbi:hypothetical protein TNCV_84601 [Trichonephila clavipes]|nr:hypothetical protein TNCV_84601 [Trichonephila clavipes]
MYGFSLSRRISLASHLPPVPISELSIGRCDGGWASMPSANPADTLDPLLAWAGAGETLLAIQGRSHPL